MRVANHAAQRGPESSAFYPSRSSGLARLTEKGSAMEKLLTSADFLAAQSAAINAGQLAMQLRADVDSSDGANIGGLLLARERNFLSSAHDHVARVEEFLIVATPSLASFGRWDSNSWHSAAVIAATEIVEAIMGEVEVPPHTHWLIGEPSGEWEARRQDEISRIDGNRAAVCGKLCETTPPIEGSFRTLMLMLEKEMRIAWRAARDDAAVRGTESTAAKLEDFTHNADFTQVRWNGKTYPPFTPKMAAAVKYLWQQWKKHLPTVRQSSVIAEINSDANRLRDIFTQNGKLHSFWNDAISTEEAKGTVRIKGDFPGIQKTTSSATS